MPWPAASRCNLEAVPWRQALELILQAKGLDHRQLGSVLLVAPAAEIARSGTTAAGENQQRMQQLAPVRTEHIQIGYARAADLWSLFNAAAEQDARAANQSSALIDERTNAIIFTGTAAQIEQFRSIVKALDVPARQVLIRVQDHHRQQQFLAAVRGCAGGVWRHRSGRQASAAAWRFPQDLGGAAKLLGPIPARPA